MISYHLCFRYRYVLHHIRRIQRQIHCRRYLQFRLRLHFTKVIWSSFLQPLHLHKSVHRRPTALQLHCLFMHRDFRRLQVTNSKIDFGAGFSLVHLIPNLRFHFSNRDLLVHLRHDDHQGLSFIVDSSLIFQSVNITHLLSVGVIVENVSLTL